MKPFIVFIHNDEKVQLTEEEFKDYINEAYTQGYHDGFDAAKSSSITTTPINPINPINPPGTTGPWPVDGSPIVWCSSAEDKQTFKKE